MADVDVVIAGAGPAGLLLAAELGLAGVRPLVLERQAVLAAAPKEGGLGGRVLDVLRHRGLLAELKAAAEEPDPTPRFPFGGVHLDFSGLDDSPMRAVRIPQARLEALFHDRARALGAEVRWRHEVVGLEQDADSVAVAVRGPEGEHRVTARYLVGCDGARSRVRDLAGIGFPGTTYPEVNRLAEVVLPDSVARLPDGGLDVPGLGGLRPGFTRTGRGVFAFGPVDGPSVSLFTTEDEDDPRDDEPMGLDEFRASVRRVLGADLPMSNPTRLSRFTFQSRHAERYRDGRVLLVGDAAHLFPATGVAVGAGLLDAVNLAWKLAAAVEGRAPAGLLDTYGLERRHANERTLLHTNAQVALRRGLDPAADALRELFQELVADEQPLRRLGGLLAGAARYPGDDENPLVGTFVPDLLPRTEDPLLPTARPVLLDLADRADLREAAAPWSARIDIRTATTPDRPSDALLIRPDGHLAWTAGGPEDLRAALAAWFGDSNL